MPGLKLKPVYRLGFAPHWFSEVLNGVRADIAPDMSPVTATATIIVAASDSKDTTRADFVVPAGSTSAQTVINAAIGTLPATGGKVVLLEGTYIVDGPINVPSNVTLAGQGPETVIKVKDALNAAINVVQNADQTNGNTKIVLKDFAIDGNKANNTTGSSYGVFLTKTTNSLIDGLLTINCGMTGIMLEESSYNTLIKIFSLTNNGSGIQLFNGSTHNFIGNGFYQGNFFSGIYLNESLNIVLGNSCCNNNQYGICIISSYNLVAGNICSENLYHGIALSGATENILFGNICKRNNQHGLYFYQSSNNLITGNFCSENSQASNASYDNIFLDNFCNFNNIQNNTCRIGAVINRPRYGIYISLSNCNKNIIFNNDLLDSGITGNLNNAGTNTIIQNNRGYSTEYQKTTGASVAIGLSGAYGAATAFTPVSGMIRGFDVNINIGGTFGTGETVTVKIETLFSDGTTAYVEKSFTAVGSLALGATDKIALIKGGVYITKINAYAKSSAASTTVTCSVDIAAAT